MPNIINSTDFANFTQAWVSLIGNANNFGGNPSPVELAFRNANAQPDSQHRLTCASFAQSTIGTLLAAPSIDHINVRFGLANGEFLLILYAANAQNNPVSDYFGPEQYWSTSLKKSSLSQKSILDRVPAAKVQPWLNNWADTSPLQSGLFDVSNVPAPRRRC